MTMAKAKHLSCRRLAPPAKKRRGNQRVCVCVLKLSFPQVEGGRCQNQFFTGFVVFDLVVLASFPDTAFAANTAGFLASSFCITFSHFLTGLAQCPSFNDRGLQKEMCSIRQKMNTATQVENRPGLYGGAISYLKGVRPSIHLTKQPASQTQEKPDLVAPFLESAHFVGFQKTVRSF